MAFVTAALIVGGGAALGAGISGGLGYAGAQAQANAAGEGAGVIGDATKFASFLNQANLSQVRRLLGPYMQLGSGAASTLGSLTVSPDEQLRQREIQRNQLVSAIPNPVTNADIPTLTGKNASERWAALGSQMVSERNAQIAEAQKNLTAFDAETEILKRGFANPTKMEASPLYKFQEELGSRNINRELAARGLYNSGAGLETIRQFQSQLGAEESDRQFNRLFGLLGIGANATSAYTGAATGTTQAQGNLALQGGQAAAQGIQGASAANAAGLNAIGNATSGLVNTGVQYSLYSQLINRLPGQNGIGQDASLYNMSQGIAANNYGLGSPGGNAFGLPSTVGPQLNTGVGPYTGTAYSMTGP